MQTVLSRGITMAHIEDPGETGILLSFAVVAFFVIIIINSRNVFAFRL